MKKEKKYYLDLLAVKEYVDDLIKYCEQQANDLRRKIERDTQKNEQLRYDYQEFEYQEYYNTGLNIRIYDNNINTADYDDFASYQNASTNQIFNDLRNLTISLHLNYRSGKSSAMIDHIHNFVIRFEPNASYFEYELSDTDEEYRDVLDTITKKLEAFPAVRTIFSKKAE